MYLRHESFRDYYPIKGLSVEKIRQIEKLKRKVLLIRKAELNSCSGSCILTFLETLYHYKEGIICVNCSDEVRHRAMAGGNKNCKLCILLMRKLLLILKGVEKYNGSKARDYKSTH